MPDVAASPADRRARMRELRAGFIRRLPAPAADGLRRVAQPLRASAQGPHQLANLEATVVAAMATNEAGIIGLSQEVARLEARVEELAAQIDALDAGRRADRES